MSTPTNTSSENYPSGFRLYNERRRAEAEARRLEANEPVGRTPSGRISRARFTPEERSARRAEANRLRKERSKEAKAKAATAKEAEKVEAEARRKKNAKRNARRRVLRAARASPIADILALDVGESRPRPAISDEERASRRQTAVRTRTLRKLRSTIRERRLKSEPAVLVKRVVNERFKSISDASFTAERVSQVVNSINREVSRALGLKKPNHAIRIHVNVSGAFEKGTGEKATFFYNINKIIHSLADLDVFLLRIGVQAADPIFYRGSNSTGSGWVFQGVSGFRIGVSHYEIRTARGWVELPKAYQNPKKGLVNIQNEDDRCFQHCIVAALHPPNNKPTRVDYYLSKKVRENILPLYDWSGVKFPSSVLDVRRFEKNNGIAINVFTLDEEIGVRPNSISDLDAPTTINLLLYKKHWILISNLDRLINSGGGTSMHHCPRCLHGFRSKDNLARHLECCSLFKPCKVKMPVESRTAVKFNDTKSLTIPIAVYADFEAINEPIPGDGDKKTVHKVVSARFHVEKPGGGIDWSYVGEDAVQRFLDEIYRIYPLLSDSWMKNVPLHMTSTDKADFTKTTQCKGCDVKFGDGIKKCRHHDHATGDYKGAYCNSCNLKMRLNSLRIPIVFHNGKGYDFHPIVKALTEEQCNRVFLIADNTEKYKTMSINGYKFVDSLSFLPSGLASLANNLVGEECDLEKAPRFHEKFRGRLSEEAMRRFLRKGVFPYKWFDNIAKLEVTQLPEKADFWSDLTGDHISDDDYKQALWVWEAFGCKTFRDYHDIYLESDVALLADIFEEFRRQTQSNIDIDPLHYISLPSMAFDGAVKTAKETHKSPINLVTDPDMYMMFERGIRGGVSQISHRYAKANNPHLEDYNPNEPNSYIMYLDANNLYGWAMMQKLPVSGFEWVDDMPIDDVLAGDWSGDTGLFVEVDLEYPQELHDAHNDLPLAPEKVNLGFSDASPTAQAMFTGVTTAAKNEKLCGHFRVREKYVVHARVLQLYARMGMRITKLHRAIKCKQDDFLKPWIEMNSNKRAKAKTDFEKDLFKLSNNAVFGKTMQNQRAQRDVKIALSDQQMMKFAAKSSFDSRFQLEDDSTNVVCTFKKEEVVLDKPIFMGAAILDFSKELMFKFHYDVVKAKYGDKAKLLFTDTDSLCYHIETEDVYKDLEGELGTYFDFSAYPQDHPLFSNTNKKVPGFFKDEAVDGSFQTISEFCGLRAKMYSYSVGGKDKFTAKGIKKCVAKKELNLKLYKEVLNGKTDHQVTQTGIRSNHHEIYTMEVTKKGLAGYDDKRWIRCDGIATLAHGHYTAA